MIGRRIKSNVVPIYKINAYSSTNHDVGGKMCMCVWSFGLQFKPRVDLQKMLIENVICWLILQMRTISLV